MGGWRGNPKSLLNLRPGRIAFMPKCAKLGCGDIRVKGATRCRRHGGSRAVKATTPQQQRIRDARRVIDHARRDGRIPPELEAQAIWDACKTKALVPLRPMLLTAWLSADPWAWPQAIMRVELEIGARTNGRSA